MVAGVAAIIRSYYPALTAEQVKKVIMDSCVKNNDKLKKPGTKGELVSLSELSVTGGNVNVYEAIKLASKIKGRDRRNLLNSMKDQILQIQIVLKV